MLYERWRETVRDRRGRLALRDLATGRQWNFGELDNALEMRAESGQLAFPAGVGAEFILAVLEAWRRGQAVCPLEPGQSVPVFEGLPSGIAHIKTTSATTGSARYVLFTASQLMADAENIVQTMGLNPDCPNLGVISLAHSYGFSNLVLPLLLHGIPLVLAGSGLPEVVRRGAGA